MARQNVTPFLFINQSQTQGPRSQRERELQDAERKSHAARHAKAALLIKKRRTLALHAYRLNHERASASTLSTTIPRTRLVPKLEDATDHDVSSFRSRRFPISKGSQIRPIVKPPSPLDSALFQGQSRRDPFDTASITGLPAFIDDLLDYGMWKSPSCSGI